MRLCVFGAFDRFNYGDLLFPLVLERGLKNASFEKQWEYYGLIASDLSRAGGKPTESISRFLLSSTNEAPRTLIIAGGEVLDASWTTVTSYLLPKAAEVLIRGTRKLLGERITDGLSRRYLGLNYSRPFVIAPDQSDGQMLVLYNAVGGSGILKMMPSEKELLARELNKASYISVRDRATKEQILSLGIDKEVYLAPDSGILISDIFQAYAEEQVYSAHIPNILETEQPYLCFQCSRRFANGREQEIAEQLISVCRKQKLRILLLSIGLATGHEDDVAVNRIGRVIGDRMPVLIPDITHIRQIAYYISKSALFMGTSLHGVITAISYGVPYVGFAADVSKLHCFLETWTETVADQPAQIENINDAVDKALSFHRTRRLELSARLKTECYKNFDRMNAVIERASIEQSTS